MRQCLEENVGSFMRGIARRISVHVLPGHFVQKKQLDRLIVAQDEMSKRWNKQDERPKEKLPTISCQSSEELNNLSFEVMKYVNSHGYCLIMMMTINFFQIAVIFVIFGDFFPCVRRMWSLCDLCTIKHVFEDTTFAWMMFNICCAGTPEKYWSNQIKISWTEWDI